MAVRCEARFCGPMRLVACAMVLFISAPTIAAQNGGEEKMYSYTEEELEALFREAYNAGIQDARSELAAVSERTYSGTEVADIAKNALAAGRELERGEIEADYEHAISEHERMLTELGFALDRESVLRSCVEEAKVTARSSFSTSAEVLAKLRWC